MPSHLHRRRRDPSATAAPVLLPTFFAATVVIVLAVVALDRLQSDLADAGVLLLAVVLAGLFLAAIGRLLRDQGPEAGDDPPDRADGAAP